MTKYLSFDAIEPPDEELNRLSKEGYELITAIPTIVITVEYGDVFVTRYILKKNT